jgi:hypothetical protein
LTPSPSLSQQKITCRFARGTAGLNAVKTGPALLDFRDSQNIQLRSACNALCYIMDWQQIAALTVVAATAGMFLRSKLRRRAFSFARDTHCGCSSPTGTGAKGSIVFSARKGRRARIIVKAN